VYDRNQSAYRQGHSTETVHLKVVDDILMAMEEGKEALLVHLDLSAAFDTVDDKILIDGLQQCVGQSGSVLKWFLSYLTGRKLAVVVSDGQSACVSLKYGVPQGSVLGPILFTIYNLPLSDIMRTWGVPFQL
jgi:hypothetical protein